MVLSDVVMPNLDGIEMLREIRKEQDVGSLPVILVTAQAGEDVREVGFVTGASDYMVRPFSSSELVSRIQVQLRLKSLQKELQRAVDRHRRLSTVDDLTGLANRRHFLDICHRELSRARRHKLAMTICALDIDHLREVNERVGHRAGDALIAEVADVIQRQLRNADLLARFAGGAFALLLPHTDVDQARAAAERIRSAVASHAFPGQAAGDVTASLGIATYPDGALESVEELVNSAQASLDRAKSRGGDRLEAQDVPGRAR
jgi:diguanylate cyclase (GGDEF)-like protein